MKLIAFRSPRPNRGAISKTLLIMKLTAILLLAATFQLSAKSYGQNVTLSVKNAPLQKVFKQINKQTGYQFFYKDDLLDQAGKVDINVNNAPLADVLDICFKNLSITYTITDKVIVVKPIEIKKENVQDVAPPPIVVTGRVVNENGEPVSGATVTVKGTSISASTNSNGVFEIKPADANATLVISATNIETFDIKLNGRTSLDIAVKIKVSSLDEIHVIGYGTTTNRLTTGSIAKMRGDDIRKQPVENPLLAMGGRLPGLQITQTNGLAGGPVGVIIRGKNSVGAGPEPLYVIDGVPFGGAVTNVTLGNGIQVQTLGGISTASVGTSPFVSLNPSDIESIEVLKDADATAIYGSRGANGVVLITTRKARTGKTTVDASFYTGWGKPTRLPDMMNTQQYVMMRNEAFRNDGIVPNTTNATDLTIWDTTRYVNWTKMLVGNTARNYDAQIRLSGGGQQTQFSLTTGYHREIPIYYGDFHDDKINVHASMSHRSSDNKFSLALNTTYSLDNNNLITTNIGQVLNTVPNAPYPFDSTGSLVWRDKGVNFTNPFGYVKKQYKGLTENSISNINLAYRFSKSFQVKVDGGMNIVNLNQKAINPTTSQSPFSGTPAATADFFTQIQRNWIIEPQAEFTHKIAKGKLQVLAGGSFQQQLTEGTRTSASGYTSDELLWTPGPAATKAVTSAYAKYRYDAAFGRVSYNWDGKYLVNISGRHDGSSRFGSKNKFGNFGAVGLGWIFTEEKFMKNLSFINYGKIRVSTGVTGNDRIGDYQYIAQWYPTSSAIAYQGATGLYPLNLENPAFGWERNKKNEAGLELGFLNNRVSFSADYYRNRTDNQLIGYTLPTQTGFTNVTANREALVQNTGWEFVVSSTNMRTKFFTWKSSFNMTIPRNKLVAYPDLATSSYASVFLIGQPITIRKFTDYQGVDPTTGVYVMNGINLTTDRTIVADLAQRYYGGFQNSFTYKNWSLDVFFHFVKQNGLSAINFTAPGGRSNQFTSLLDRWQNKGDITETQKYSTTGTAVTNFSYYSNYSDARVVDASFIRLKNVALSYEFDKKLIQKIKADNIRVYLQMQNLATYTKYKIGDPETLSFSDAPLKMITVGCQVVF